MDESAYIMHTRDFLRHDENVYKIGRSAQEGTKRANSYPKGSRLMIQKYVNNSRLVEAEIIKVFKVKFKHRPEFGNEYFEGHYPTMEIEFLVICNNNIINNNVCYSCKESETSCIVGYCINCNNQVCKCITNLISDNFVITKNPYDRVPIAVMKKFKETHPSEFKTIPPSRFNKLMKENLQLEQGKSGSQRFWKGIREKTVEDRNLEF